MALYKSGEGQGGEVDWPSLRGLVIGRGKEDVLIFELESSSVFVELLVQKSILSAITSNLKRTDKGKVVNCVLLSC